MSFTGVDHTSLAASFVEEEDRLAGSWCDFDVERLAEGFVLNLLPRMVVGLV